MCARWKRMKTLSIANLKGGSGKTAMAHALGASLASMGRRVLLVDCDPQASLTVSCGILDAGGHSLAEVLGNAKPGDLALVDIIQDLDGGLALAPGDIALADTELYLPGRMAGEQVLKRALATVDYDLAILDCPPSFSLLVVNALTASDAVLVPVVPEYVGLRGLAIFLDGIAQVRANTNPGLELLGVVATFYDGRLRHHRAAMEDMRAGGLPLVDERETWERLEQALLDRRLAGESTNRSELVEQALLAWLGG